MAYLNVYLDVCAAYGWNGGPEGKTQIVEMANGRERRNADWDDVRHRYILPFLNIKKEQYRVIKNHHLVCRQMLHAFRYRDHLDDRAEDEFFGLGDGTTTTFQLSKFSELDGIVYQRRIYAIPTEPDDFEVYVNGVATTAYTLDRDRGVIEFDAAPAEDASLTWTGTFDVWVRFAQDWLPFSIDNLNAVNGSVDLIEVAPPPLVTT